MAVDRGQATQPLLPVTQADRDAVAAYWMPSPEEEVDHLPWVRRANAAKQGQMDDDDLIQAFARHRISHSLPGDLSDHFPTGLRSELPRTAGGMAVPSTGVRTDCHCGWSTLATDEQEARQEWAAHAVAALTPSPCPGDGMRDALENDNEWVCAGIPDEAIEAGIAAWRAADVAMLAREESEHPEDMADWDEGMIVAAIFKAVGRAISGPSALSGDAGEGE